MEKRIEELEHKIDQHEQYFRCNCILFYGIPESPNENTNNVLIKTFMEHFDINITEDDINPSHQVGKQSTN